jgi:hypothetical protein
MTSIGPPLAFMIVDSGTHWLPEALKPSAQSRGGCAFLGMNGWPPAAILRSASRNGVPAPIKRRVALWKIAILMSWEALAAGVIRIGISSQRRQNPKVQRVVALDERRVAFCCASWSAGGPYAPRNSFAKIKRYGRIGKALPNNIAAILVTPSQSESRSNAVVSMKVVHVI